MRRRGPKPRRSTPAYVVAGAGLVASALVAVISVIRYQDRDPASAAAARPTPSSLLAPAAAPTSAGAGLATAATATAATAAPTTAPPSVAAVTVVAPGTAATPVASTAPTTTPTTAPTPSVVASSTPGTTARVTTTRAAAPRTITISNARVSTGKSGGRPVDSAGQLPLDARVACVFWQTTGVDVGTPVQITWLVEGTPLASATRTFTWNYADGVVVNWCAPSVDGTPGDTPLPPGRHAVALLAAGHLVPIASFRVG
jgi:hypothetical protein